MPRDTSDQGLSPRTDFAPAPEPFMSAGEAAGLVIDQLEAAQTKRAAVAAERARIEANAEDAILYAKMVVEAVPVAADAPDWQRRRAKVWAVAENVRKVLADTLQGEFTDEQINGAAELIVDMPEGWIAYRPWEGTPPALASYKAALRELADPALTVKRLDDLAGFAFDTCQKHLASAQETIGRFSWASAKPDQLLPQLGACIRCAAKSFDEAARLRGLADGKRTAV